MRPQLNESLFFSDVFVAGADGVHTYRIPSLIVAPGGTLLAFCEARKTSGNDASPTDLVLRRSLDQGRSWEPMQIVVRGEGPEAIMNPCPVVDGGANWQAPVYDPHLNEVQCQAGLIRIPPEKPGAPSRYLFSNPDARPGPDGGARTRLTVRLSKDEGRTWPSARLIHAGPSCYSCPAALPDGRVGLLYECGEAWRYERIRLARFSPGWVESGEHGDANRGWARKKAVASLCTKRRRRTR